jgi:simple sugar transport system permease protein
LLDQIPVFGRLFSQQPVVWIALLLVVVTHIVMFFTRWGLRTRAVGEHPRAADTVGVNVFLMRYANVMIGGAIAGLGGVYLVAEVSIFSPGMTVGRGFIALAALIFGKWTPFGSWGAALLFGFAQAVQINIQQCGVDFPAQFLGMLPYLVTIVVLAGVVGRSVGPAAAGVPYQK